MSGAALTSPLVSQVIAALAERRPVVVTGTVADDVLVAGISTALTEAIAQAWRSATDALVALWHPTDGLRPHRPEDGPELERLLQQPQGLDPLGELRDELGGSAKLGAQDPIEVAGHVRQLLAQSERLVLVIVIDGEALPTLPGDPAALRLSGQVSAALRETAGPAPGNGIVLLSSDDRAIPRAFTDAPWTAHYRAGAPSEGERLAVLAAHRDQFFGAPDMQSDRLAACVEVAARLSDGLSRRELAALPALSHAERLGLDTPRELLAQHRLGERRDPWRDLTPERLRNLPGVLQGEVFGQPLAVRAVVQRIGIAWSGLAFTPPTVGTRPPRASMFLVGPTGVGKNEMVRSLARFLFGDPNAVSRFDMAEYQEAHSFERLTGSPPGYVAHEDGGQLVRAVAQRPFSILLFDEIEKAHPRVFDRLLAIVDEGRVTDGRGRTVSLEHCVIVFTSNLGGRAVLDRVELNGTVPSAEEVIEITRGAVEQHISRDLGRPEVFHRLEGALIAFDLLREDAVDGIVSRMLGWLKDSARQRHGIELRLDESEIAERIRTQLGPPGTWNGRRIRDLLAGQVLVPLALDLAGLTPSEFRR